MKIVFLSPAAQGGGAEEVLFDLVAGLRKDYPSWRMQVICGESGPLCERLRLLEVETEILPFPASFLAWGEQASSGSGNRLRRRLGMVRAAIGFLRYCVTLMIRLAWIHPDIVHSNGMKMHLSSVCAAGRGAAIVWHMHDYLSTRRLTSRLLPRFGSRVALVLANSRSVAADARKVLPNTRVEVLENSVDLARFRPEGEKLDLDRLSGLAPAPPNTVKVGLVGTFARWKGQDLFLQAVARVPKDIPARFYIIGGPVYATAGSQWTKDELMSVAGSAADEVGFTGWVADAAAAIRALDIVVHASIKPEPFGLVILQALACGRAVIVSGEGGALEIAEGLPGAVTFTPRDAQSLADAMLLVITRQETRLAASETGPVAVGDRYGRNQMTTQAAAYFRGLAPHDA